MPTIASPRTDAAQAGLYHVLHDAAEPLPDPADAAGFGTFFDRLGDARAAISRRLIEYHGFSIVAVEADRPDAARIDDYARHRAPRPRRGSRDSCEDAFVWFEETTPVTPLGIEHPRGAPETYPFGL